MGHSSKKKKKRSGGGGGRKSRARDPSKDHCSDDGDDRDLLSEEMTALAAIFEDIKIVSDSPYTQFVINLRPYSNDMGIEDNISALLLVRCLPGYPYKCPKLEIIPEKGLMKEDADQLLSLLLDQATFYAREGRVMIFNLVEAAQEFLSKIVPSDLSLEFVHCLGSNRNDQPLHEDATLLYDRSCYSLGPSVYGSVDLYSDLCGDDVSFGSCGTKVDRGNSSKISREQTQFRDKNINKSILLHSHVSGNIENVVTNDHFIENEIPDLLHSAKAGVTPRTTTKLNIVDEEGENDDRSLSPRALDIEFMLDTSEKDSNTGLFQDLILGEKTTNADSEDESLTSFVSVTHDSEFESEKIDLLMVHLLHLACSAKGSLAHALPEISSELYNLGMLSERAKDLAAEPPSNFSNAFGHAFGQHMASSRISQFWKTGSDLNCDNTSSLPNSRYLSDFEEVRSLGRGGFGHVVLCKNKLDGRQYAVKKIRLKNKSMHDNERIKREVATLSRLQHQHVVRYYQAWTETEFGNHHGETALGSQSVEDPSWSCTGASLANTILADDNQETMYLYIQMEYCPRTLREDFESYGASFDKEYAWHLFRQIVEGLAHIHSQGIIHRDLTPSNIFFDVRNDIKIGDFGLAKFLELEQLDHDQYYPTKETGLSMDGTGQVGTYFYTAPEIEQRWPHINEKVDMYSLGVVFFELWHPFPTAMERHIVLSDLKQTSSFPQYWVEKFPDQSALLRRLMSPSPADRPSAAEILQHALPPRMEDEWLNDILRTIKTSEDTYVYDRVVATIFDEERLDMKAHCQHGSSEKMTVDDSSFKQYTEANTELRDNAIEVAKEVFRQHGAKRLEISPMRVFNSYHPLNRKTVKLLTRGGNMLELCYELRSPFINWITTNQKLTFKRYEVSWVYRKAIGHSTPNRFLQGDFDIIGGAPPLTEAEAIKVAMDIATRFFHSDAIDIRLNHGQILEAIWSWVGISSELRQNVAELLSLNGLSCPQSTSRKENWKLIRRQLLQDLNLSEAIVDRLQTADLRFCVSADKADKALARLRGALSPDKSTRKALEELLVLFNYLRVWKIEKYISLDLLMPPTENYYSGPFFQIYLKENSSRSISKATLLAVGGRYDQLVHQMWEHEHKSNPPGAVGVSFALEKILLHCSMDIRPFRIEPNSSVLVCSKGGGGLLQERMEFVAELWQAKLKAEFVPVSDPSLTEQFEYASEHDIKCLIIITEAGLPQTGLIKVRHLELKKEKELERGMIIKFLTDAISTKFRNLAIWN